MKRIGKKIFVFLTAVLLLMSLVSLPVLAADTIEVERVAGANRYETAIAASKSAYPDGASNVVIATGLDYPNALTGGVLAATLGAPLLLVKDTGDSLSPVLAEIQRLGATKVYILGGTDAVSQAIEDQIKTKVSDIKRVAGENRYGTAEEVAKLVGVPSDGHVFLVSGKNFADALAIAPVAGRDGIPILLTHPTILLDVVLESLESLGVTSVTIIGGVAAVSESLEALLEDEGVEIKDRIGGARREATAVSVALRFFDCPDLALLANGWEGYPDALVGGYLGALYGVPMLLIKGDRIHDDVMAYLEEKCAATLIVLGGPDAVSEDVEEAIAEIEKEEPGGGGPVVPIPVSAISVDDVPVVGMTIKAKDLSPTNATVDYQWQRVVADDGDEYGAFVDIDGATDATYTLKGNGDDGDVGALVRLQVTGKGNYSGMKHSEPIGPVVEATEAVFVVTDNIGIAPDSEENIEQGAAGKIFAEYELKDSNNNGEKISLAVDKVEDIKVKVNDGDWQTLIPNKDSTLWFNVENAQGERTYVVKVKDYDNTYYTAELNWEKEINEATWVATGKKWIKDDPNDPYVEYKLVNSDEISLLVGQVKLIAQEVSVKWVELEPNTDGTMWFPSTAEPGDRDFFVVTNDGTMYKATLNWQGGDGYAKDVARAAIKPSWKIDSIKGICTDNYPYDDTKSDQVMKESDLPGALKNNGEDIDIGYQVTIKTSYADSDEWTGEVEARTVTTYFTVPEGVTVWYPVWEKANDGEQFTLAYKEANGEEVAYGMVGHPLILDNITDDAKIYIAPIDTLATEFEFIIKLVDAEEGWEDVVYGEETLTVKRSKYEFGVEDETISIPAVDCLESGNKIEVNGNNGGLNNPGSDAYSALKAAIFGTNENGDELEQYKIEVTLKAIEGGDFGYTNRNVKINKLGVEYDGDEDEDEGDLKVYLYAHQDKAWFDLVECVWGNMPANRGFNLYKDENTKLEAYAFATKPGEYTITFEAIDIDNGDAKICKGTATITVREKNDPD